MKWKDMLMKKISHIEQEVPSLLELQARKSPEEVPLDMNMGLQEYVIYRLRSNWNKAFSGHILAYKNSLNVSENK